MSATLNAFAALMLSCQSAVAFQAGDQAVVIRPVEMKTITGPSHVLSPGTTVAIREIEGERLKVAVGRVGWIVRNAVIAADRADDHFTAQIDKNSSEAV